MTGPTCGECSDASATWPGCVPPPPCGGNNCSGHGTCVDLQCVCQPGFLGADCEICTDAGDVYPACGAPTGYGVDSEAGLVTCPFCGVSLADFAAPAEPGDSVEPVVRLAVPPDGASVPAGGVFVLLIDDVVDPTTITPSTLVLTPEGSAAKFAGSVVVQKNVTGNTLVMFLPSNLAYSGPVTLKLDGVKDDGGNALVPWQTTVTIAEPLSSGFEANLGFENSTFGCVLTGDVGASTGSAEMTPSEGELQLVLTTKDEASVGGEMALNGLTSAAVCGPIFVPPGKTKLLFDYDFASGEFDEFVGQGFDDLAVVVVAGRGGGTGGIPVSVNTVSGGIATTAYGLPEGNDVDQVARRAGRATATFSGIDHLGGLATLTFIVTDVADVDYSSVLTIDNVRFE